MSRQLAERGEACLLRLSLAHARGGSQDEERVLTTVPSPSPLPSPWTCSSSIGVRLPEAYCTIVSSLLDLPKRRRAKCKVHTSTNCWTSRRGKEPSARFTRVWIVEPPEEARSQAQGFIGVVVLVGVYYNYSKQCYCLMPPRHLYPKLCHLFFSMSVLDPMQQPHKLHVHITHLLVINSKG